MASGTPTTNLGLRTMTDADSVDAQDINYNSGILDTKIGAVGSTSLQGQVNALNTNTNRREVQKAVYAQLNDNGNPSTSTLTAYPTTAGLFRVGAKSACPGLPTDSNGYGPLLIFNAGGYVLHVHKATNGRMWYGTTENVISAPSSWIEIAQNDNLTSENISSNIAFESFFTPDTNYRFIKNNKSFYFMIISSGNISMNDNTLIGTISTNSYKPTCGHMIPIYDYTTSKPFNGSVFIGTDGSIKYYGDNIQNKKVTFSDSYVQI